ncbi:MAG TPA: CBS domain-containing protein, partial [Candidatus Lachnoclostridium stercoravium]|nr:CBS domain-containing protein [Candidatus Lachnoclostridium stercoravium]
VPVTAIPRRMDYKPVRADARMEDMIDRALDQNFIPVVDDQKNFIGIIKRKDIIKYFYDKMGREERKTASAQGKRIVLAGV